MVLGSLVGTSASLILTHDPLSAQKTFNGFSCEGDGNGSGAQESLSLLLSSPVSSFPPETTHRVSTNSRLSPQSAWRSSTWLKLDPFLVSHAPRKLRQKAHCDRHW